VINWIPYQGASLPCSGSVRYDAGDHTPAELAELFTVSRAPTDLVILRRDAMKPADGS